MMGRVIGTLTILLAAKLVISEGIPAVPLPVHGIIGQSVHLTLPVGQTGPEEEEIYWIFQNIILAHFSYNHLKIRNEKFEKRLETPDNGRTLRVTNLRKEDGGIYSATIYSADMMTYNTSYNLTLYGPVPSLAIQTEWKEHTIDGCNVTLHCSVPPNTSDVSYTWKCRQNTEYQLCNTGSTIQVSLPPDHQDMEYLCIVQNPADQKNISIHSICPNLLTSNKGTGPPHRTLFILPVAFLLITILGLFLLKRVPGRRKDEKTTNAESKEMSDIHYADLGYGSQSSDNQRSKSRDEESGEVVYTAVVLRPMGN